MKFDNAYIYVADVNAYRPNGIKIAKITEIGFFSEGKINNRLCFKVLYEPNYEDYIPVSSCGFPGQYTPEYPTYMVGTKEEVLEWANSNLG